MTAAEKRPVIPISPAAALVAIGVVYGDIGTSPMYVMKSIVAGNGGLQNTDPQLILGALSLVIWTLTLLTTVKYVLVASRQTTMERAVSFPFTASCAAAGSIWWCWRWWAALPFWPTVC